MGWGYSSSSRKRGAHEKSMGSYEMHAHSDAISIAYLLEKELGSSRARAIYEKIDEPSLRKYEADSADIIADFIKRTESQRPSVLKKIKDERTRVAFLVLAIIGCLRAKATMELRDNYRMAMVPGSGNRVTTAALYRFAMDMQAIFDYAWPFEAFLDAELSDDEDGDHG